jgi:hypothetical protein
MAHKFLNSAVLAAVPLGLSGCGPRPQDTQAAVVNGSSVVVGDEAPSGQGKGLAPVSGSGDTPANARNSSRNADGSHTAE